MVYVDGKLACVTSCSEQGQRQVIQFIKGGKLEVSDAAMICFPWLAESIGRRSTDG
jgi:hypothetical protein